jgi:hypothetical protein
MDGWMDGWMIKKLNFDKYVRDRKSDAITHRCHLKNAPKILLTPDSHRGY